MRALLRTAAGLLVMIALVGAWGYRNARADPVVRRATIALPGWPAGAKPVLMVLLSDIHVGSLAMDAGRMGRIVAQVNALQPDLVVLAGDHVSDHAAARGAVLARELTAPLRRLSPRLGTVAVLGNHDHWTDPPAIRRALRAAGVTMLDNEVVVRGPLAIVGIGDSFTRHDRVGPAVAALRQRVGARLALSHSPDLVKQLPADVPLLIAGHTHCGQIVLPVIGPIANGGLFDPRYRCGLVRDAGRATIVTAGLGTSVVPIRFGAPPDLWLLTLGPADPR